MERLQLLVAAILVEAGKRLIGKEGAKGLDITESSFMEDAIRAVTDRMPPLSPEDEKRLQLLVAANVLAATRKLTTEHEAKAAKTDTSN